MGTCIESVATARSHHGPFAPGALGLAEEAARTCLERAGKKASDVDLLLNTGLYKDDNLAEPALASIIQEDIGANLGHPPREGRHGTFSFDVINGACGVLSAAHLVDALVSGGGARLGLIVAEDIDPSPRTSHGFPFRPAGGGLLLGHTDRDEGFRSFEFRTFPAFASLFEARLEWEATERRNALHVREDPSFGERAVECAIEATTDFLARAKLRAGDVDLLIASQYPPRFAEHLANAIALPLDRVPVVREHLTATHTAGPIASLEASFDAGTFARARRILFVTAGAGVTIATALYEKSRAIFS